MEGETLVTSLPVLEEPSPAENAENAAGSAEELSAEIEKQLVDEAKEKKLEQGRAKVRDRSFCGGDKRPGSGAPITSGSRGRWINWMQTTFINHHFRYIGEFRFVCRLWRRFYKRKVFICKT